MQNSKKERKYPENLDLKVLILKSGKTVKELAATIGVSRQALNLTVNGHYKGVNIKAKLLKELEQVN